MRRAGDRRLTLIGTLMAAATIAAVIVAFTGTIPFTGASPASTISAEVPSIDALRAGDPVRVDGVQVGTVATTGLDPSGRAALIKLSIADARLTVHSDARITLRWPTFLGGATYVDLDPGTPAAPPLGDHVLPLAQTSSQVELDDLLQIAGPPTPMALRALLDQTAAGLSAPVAVGRLLGTAPLRLETIGRGLAPLVGEQPGDLSDLLAASARTVGVLDRNRAALDALVQGAAGTFGTTSAQRQALGDALGQAPAALEQTDTLMRRLPGTLALLDPLARSLRPGLQATAATLPSTRALLLRAVSLLQAARPLLGALPTTLDNLAAASNNASRLIDGVNPILARTRSELLPWLDAIDPDTKLKTYEAIGPTLAVADHSEFDNGGYLLPFPADVDLGGSQDAAAFGLSAGSRRPCGTLLADPTATETQRCQALAQLLGEPRLLGGRR